MKKLLHQTIKLSLILFFVLVTSIFVWAAVPTFTSVPSGGAVGVNQSGNIVLTFSEAIRDSAPGNAALDNTTVDGHITLKLTNAAGANIPFDATIDAGKTIITIDPTSDLPSGAIIYVAVVDVEASSDDSDISPNPTSFTFTVTDYAVPTITFNPINGAIGVALASNLTITFNEAVRKIDDSPITAGDLLTLVELKLTNNGGAAVPFTASIGGGNTIITVDPTSNLTANTVYYLEINPVEDANNNAIVATNITFTSADVTPPVVTFSPVNGAIGVSETGNITISFDEPVRDLDDSPITAGDLLTLVELKLTNNAGASVPFTGSINGGNTIITIDPSATLLSTTVYYVEINPVEDFSNNAIVASNITFTTGDSQPPTITFSPVNGAVGVPIASNLTITFNEAIRKIDNSAITAGDLLTLVELKLTNNAGAAVPFTASINGLNTIITIDPTSDFTSSTLYYLEINPVEDIFDNAIVATNITFTSADIVPPVVTFNPVNGATGVIETNNITITFDEAVRKLDNSAITPGDLLTLVELKLTNNAGAPVPFTASINGGNTVITIDPTPTLSGNTVYYVEINPVEDGGNNAIVASNITFTTGDTQPPSLTFNPLNLATNVSVVGNITITFNEPIRKLDDTPITSGDLNTLVELKLTNNAGASVLFTATIDGTNTVVTIDPTPTLTSSQVYYVEMNPIEDGVNNATIAQNITFTTEASPNITSYSADPTCMGETIIINGTGFGSSVPMVTVNGINVVPSANTTTTITITVPTTTAGNATVVVTNTTNTLSDSDNTLTLKDAVALSLPLSANPSVPVVSQNYNIEVANTQIGVGYRIREIPAAFSGGFTPGTGGTLSFGPYNKGTAATYQYEIQTQSTGCTVRVYGPLAVTIANLLADAGPDVIICDEQSTIIGGSPTASGGTGFHMITWSASPADPSLAGQTNVSNPTVSPTVTTTYTVTVDDNSAATPDTDQVTVTVNPVANPANITITLTPDSAAYNVNSAPVALGYTLSGGVTGTGVFSGPGVNSSSNLFYPNAANLGQNTVTLTFTNSSGCVTLVTRNINVYSPSAYLATIDPKYCVDFGIENLSVQQLPTETFQDILYLYRRDVPFPGDYQYIPENSGFGLTFNSTTDQVTLNTNTLGVGKYIFYIYYYNSETCYFYQYVYDPVCFCYILQQVPYDCSYYYFATVEFEIIALPTLELISLATNCINDTNPEIRISPTGGTLTVNGGATGLLFSAGQYFLDVDNPALQTSIEAPNFNTLSYVYTDADNCTNTETLNVTIFEVPTIDFNNSAVCENVAKDFGLFPETSIPPGVTINRYAWSFGDGFTKTLTDINEVYSYNYPAPDDYDVTLTAITNDNCAISTQKLVTIAPVPGVNFAWENVCNDQGTAFYGTTTLSDGEINTIEWNFGDGTIITKAPPRTGVVNEFNTTGTVINPIHSFTIPSSDSTLASNYLTKFEVISTFNCVKDTTIQIYKFPNVVVDKDTSYLNGFDGPTTQWLSGGPNSSWAWDFPSKVQINSDASGAGKAWVTNSTGLYNKDEKSWVHSPCFDLRNLQRPILGFDRRLLTGPEDGAILQVNTTTSTNGNTGWQNVGILGEGLNWYNAQAVLGAPGGQVAVGWEGSLSLDSVAWRKSVIALDDYLPPLRSPARKNVRFRIAFGSDGGIPENEGFAFDNFEIDQRSRIVLVEQFTNNGSTDASVSEPNKKSNNQVNQFIGLPKTTSEIIKVEYHTGFQGPNPDELYNDNQQDASARAAFYGVISTPYTFMDAIHQSGNFYDPPNPSWAQGVFSDLSLLPGKVRIDTILCTNSPADKLNINVEFTTLDTLPPNTSIHIVVVERTITSVTGSNGENLFTYVMKKMLPSAVGTRYATGLSVGFNDIINVSWAPEAYNLDSLSIIVFAQNENTKEIYQAEFLKTPQYIPPLNLITNTEDPQYAEKINLFPNPANHVLNIELPAAVNRETPVVMFDTYGRAVYQSAFKEGEHRKAVSTAELTGGVYIVQIGTPEGGIARRKVMVVHR